MAKPKYPQQQPDQIKEFFKNVEHPLSFKSWLKAELSELNCAQRNHDRICTWPSHMNVNLTSSGAHFSLRVSLDKKGLVPLIYQDHVAIHNVKVQEEHNDEELIQSGPRYTAPIVIKSRRPWIELEAGVYTISGELLWETQPDLLQLPHAVATISLSDHGVPRTWTQRDNRGALWLLKDRSVPKKGSHNNRSPEALHLEVFRAFYDEVPLRVVTHVKLNVSGKSREVELSGLLLDQATLIGMTAPSAAEWLDDGLRLYLKPGRSELTLTSLIPIPPQSIPVPHVKGGLTQPQEIWIWHSKEQLRSVNLSGLETVDPDQTSVPEFLKNGTHTFLAKPNDVLVINEIKRGVTRPPENSLILFRQMWLNLDGSGYLIKDKISGEMYQGWRLNYQKSGELGSVIIPRTHDIGKYDYLLQEPLLITQDPKTKLEGVELREEKVNVQADAKVNGDIKQIFAVGWAHRMNRLRIKLKLPPGWLLLGVDGAESCSKAWFTSWSVFEFFIILLITLSVGRLFGWGWAGVALITLILYHNVNAQPTEAWILLLVSIALIRVLNRKGWLRLIISGYFVVSMLVFLTSSLSLSHSDIRQALYPQVVHPSMNRMKRSFYTSTNDDEREVFDEFNSPVMQYYTLPTKEKAAKEKRNKSQNRVQQNLQQIDPNAVIQTGHGIPEWRWHHYYINFSGPVEAERILTLWLLPPHWTRLCLALRALTLLAISGILLMISMRDFRKLWSLLENKEASSQLDTKNRLKTHTLSKIILSVCLSLTSLSLSSNSSVAQPVDSSANQHSNVPIQNAVEDQSVEHLSPPEVNQEYNSSLEESEIQYQKKDYLVPTQELLTELKHKISQNNTCRGECLYIPFMKLKVSGHTLELDAEIHAERDTSFTLPGELPLISWSSVTLNGQSTPLRGVKRGDVLTAQARIQRGVFTFKAVATINEIDALSLALHDRPALISLDVDGWRIQSGGNAHGNGVIELQKMKKSDDNLPQVARRSENSSKKRGVDLSWYEIHRHLIIGQSWQVETKITRNLKEGTRGVATMMIPLIEGERIMSGSQDVTQNGVRILFEENQSEVTLVSELSANPHITLVAPSDVRWTERWSLTCSVVWQCLTQGLNPTSQKTKHGNSQSKHWRPWSGEQVDILTTRPKGVKGAASTIESMKYSFKPGRTLANGSISLSIKASRGGVKTLLLPKGAQRIRLHAENAEQWDPAENFRVRLPLKRGINDFSIDWQQPWKPSFKESIPQIKIDTEVVNLTQTYENRKDQIIIGTFGPSWGGVVLIWGQLLLFIIIGWVIGGSQIIPLRRLECILLLIGCAQLPISAIMYVLCWFIMLWIRIEYIPKLSGRFLFNFLQLSILVSIGIFVIILYFAVCSHLLDNIHVSISGQRSTSSAINWYVDRLTGLTPKAGVYVIPVWTWRVFALLWSLWLASATLRWSKLLWTAWNTGGAWRVKLIPMNSDSDEVDRGKVD